MAAVQNLADTWFKDMKDYVHDESHVVSRTLGSVEQKTKIKRENFVYILMVALAVYLIFGNFASTLCNFAGFAYPAYISMKAVESRDLRDDTQWLTYWCVFAVFAMIDTVSDAILGWFPIYWLAKFIFLVWLYLPSTKGAQKIYKMFLSPFMTKYSKQIDQAGEAVEKDLRGFANEFKSELAGLKKRIDSLANESLQNSSNGNSNGHGHVEPNQHPFKEEPRREPYKEEPRRESYKEEPRKEEPHQQSNILHPSFAVQPPTNESRPTSLVHNDNKNQLQEIKAEHAIDPNHVHNHVHPVSPQDDHVHHHVHPDIKPEVVNKNQPANEHAHSNQSPEMTWATLAKEASNLNDHSEKRVSFHNDVTK